MLEKGQMKVPRGEVRRKLQKEGRVKNVGFYNRSMDELDVEDTILAAFPWVHSYTVLSADSKGYDLTVASNISPTGREVIEKRGTIYLWVEECDPLVTLSDSSDEENLPNVMAKKLKKKASSGSLDHNFPKGVVGRILKEAEKLNEKPSSDNPPSMAEPSSDPLSMAEPSSDPLSMAEPSSDHSPSVAGAQENDFSPPAPQESLKEWREIRRQQDLEYAQSLRTDQAKEYQKGRCILREGLKHSLHEKWKKAIEASSDGLKFTLRYPDGTKISCCISATSFSTKELYEVAFGCGPCTNPIHIFTIVPRCVVPLDGTLSVPFPAVLTVEESENAPDPLDYALCEEQVSSGKDATQGCSEISISPSVAIDTIKNVESKRECYLIDVLDTRNGMPHLVRRDFVYDDCLKLYTLELDTILQEFPFRISYEDERAIDTGGVARDFFCAFWEVALVKHFDGSVTMCV